MAGPGNWDHNEIEAQLQIEHQAAQFPFGGPMNGWIEPDDDPEPPPPAAGGEYQLPPGFLDSLPPHPQDPYNQPGPNEEEEDEEEEEDPEEDPEEDDFDAPGMEIDEGSDEEEEMEDQDPEEHDDKGPEYETDDGEEFIKRNRNYPVYSIDDPTVPVSHRTLRTPGGHLWRKTPRKQVPQATMIRIQLPPQAATGKARSQPWRPQGPSITETGESSRPSAHDHPASTNEGLEKRIAFLETRLSIAIRRIERMSEQNLITDLVDARTRLSDAEARIAGLQEQIDATNTLALRAEGQSVSAIQGVEDLQNLIEE